MRSVSNCVQVVWGWFAVLLVWGTTSVAVGQVSAPVVTLQVRDGVATEQSPFVDSIPDTAEVVFIRRGDVTKPLTVYVMTGGTAVAGKDYAVIGPEVVIPAGEAELAVVISALDDDIAEPDESLVISIIIPPGLPGEPSPYRVGVPGEGRIIIRDDEAGGNRLPRVAITDPEDGFMVRPGESVGVRVVARDDDGWVGGMALYVGGRLFAEQVIEFVQPPEPGQEQVFEFEWEGTEAGVYALRVRATDDQGAQSWSSPVRVGVVEGSGQTVVGIVAVDALAVEPGPDGGGDPAMFAVCRRGDLGVPLAVYYQVGGTAENGVDYEWLSGEVVIPEGQWGVRLRVVPLADDVEEAAESVVVKLVDPVCIPVEPPPVGCYRVGLMAAAEVRLMDANPVENLPPKVELLRPHDGEVFHAPADIKLVAAAGDRDGRVVQVAFYGDGELLHEWVAEENMDLDWGGQEFCAFTHVWEGVQEGLHEVVVVATDDDGASTRSRVVSLQVVGVLEPPVVRIVASDPRAVEGEDATTSRPARFRVWRTGDLAGALTVWYSVGGTATPDSDYAGLPGTVVIPEGRKSAGIEILPLPDGEVERVETVLVRLEPSPLMGPVESYRVGHPAKAMVVIVDAGEGPCEARSLPGLGFELGLRGEQGMPYRVEASDDMVHWVPVADVLGDADGRVRFVDPERRLDGPCFYRIRPSLVEAIEAMEE
ncbi:MAG: hypothetical protein RI897_2222 [Verrucomicrobiota bacterium]|jgi:hypothetical protein